MRILYKNSLLLCMIMLVIMSLAPSQMIAQTLYVNTSGTVSAQTGATIYINGNTSIDGQVDNSNANFIFNGDLSVNTTTGGYTSTGRDTFAGIGNRNINFAITGAKYLGNLVKNNTGKLILYGNVDCNTLTFLTNLPVDVTGGFILKVKDGSTTAISGYNSLRYIDVDDNLGTLSRNIASTNTYVFPVGNNVAGYRRFDMLMSSLGTTGTSFLNAKLLNGSLGGISYSKTYSSGFSGSFPSICTPGSNPQLVEFDCVADNYWNFAGPTDYEFTTLAYGAPCSPSGMGPRRTVKAPETSGFWTNYVDSIVGTLTDELCINSDWTASATIIPGGTYRGFGDFAIAGTFGAPLPIELVTFTATAVNNSFIRLDWRTASELNNAGFDLQRSIDGTIWKNIAWIDGNGTTHDPHQYNYDDHEVIPNTLYYYRLLQTDYGGKISFSKIVSASLTSEGVIVSNIFPNPSQDSRSITISLPKRQDIYLSCYDALGQEVLQKTVTGNIGNNILTIDKLAVGIYIATITVGDYKTSRKFIAQ